MRWTNFTSQNQFWGIGHYIHVLNIQEPLTPKYDVKLECKVPLVSSWAWKQNLRSTFLECCVGAWWLPGGWLDYFSCFFHCKAFLGSAEEVPPVQKPTIGSGTVFLYFTLDGTVNVEISVSVSVCLVFGCRGSVESHWVVCMLRLKTYQIIPNHSTFY